MGNLLRSRKFLTAVLDAVISTLAIVLSWFLAPEKLEQVLILVATWQPVFIAVIAGIAVEDAAALKAGTHPNQLPPGGEA